MQDTENLPFTEFSTRDKTTLNFNKNIINSKRDIYSAKAVSVQKGRSKFEMKGKK